MSSTTVPEHQSIYLPAQTRIRGLEYPPIIRRIIRWSSAAADNKAADNKPHTFSKFNVDVVTAKKVFGLYPSNHTCFFHETFTVRSEIVWHLVAISLI